MFREGQTLAGHVTHTPRLIAMDLKGDFSYHIGVLISMFAFLCTSLITLSKVCLWFYKIIWMCMILVR